jgi:hypothetical protein
MLDADRLVLHAFGGQECPPYTHPHEALAAAGHELQVVDDQARL